MPINPESIVDRDDEVTLFSELLEFRKKARVFAIRDGEGTGKTELLNKLRYFCKTEKIPPQPTSLSPLDDIKTDDTFLFVSAIRDELREIEFSTFDRLTTALRFKDATAFAVSGQNVVDTRHATISGQNNRFAGTYQEGEITNNYYAPPEKTEWDSGVEKLARDACTTAFFSDLKAIAAKQPIVILLDSFDSRCQRKLYDLIWSELVVPCFDPATRPDRLVLVIAGRELPPMQKSLGTRYSELVFAKDSLRGWKQEHIREVLVLNGINDLNEWEFNLVWAKVEEGLPILKVRQWAQTIREYRVRIPQ